MTRPYGRFFYLPYHLAQQGCDVTILLLGYDNEPPVHCYAHGMEWYVESLRPLIQSVGPLAYIRRAQVLVQTYKPDWIIGLSDTWYGILATHLGKKYGVKTLVDAYDNYESYIPWAKPLHWAWRSALRKATALTAAGPQLAALMSQGREGSSASVIPMAADPIFQPIIDGSLRKRFGLKEGMPLVGYCGSLYRNRGMEVMFKAMQLLLDDVPDAKLVISGRCEQNLEIPESIRNAVIHLGYLPDELMPKLLNVMDVLLVVNLNSAFGNYSYPVKLYEAMGCRKPVVASSTASTSWILRDHPDCLAKNGDAEQLASRVCDALSCKTKEYTSNCDWAYSASLLRDLLEVSQSVMR
ncbi:glycosyltransferase [Methyloglobulus morosus]|uniref:glycosyltransferase n=1 Tax=Methyloglobulus morosus TaxID=1410681 RepID=UPI001379F40B|nr:glycosyltransferase [Methyloglobulus morosus]